MTSGPAKPRDPRPVCVIVRARARPGKADEVRRELMAVAHLIRANPGCLDYRVYQDRADPDSFVLWERWISEEAGEENLQRRYMAAYLARCDALYQHRRWDYFDEVHATAEAL